VKKGEHLLKGKLLLFWLIKVGSEAKGNARRARACFSKGNVGEIKKYLQGKQTGGGARRKKKGVGDGKKKRALCEEVDFARASNQLNQNDVRTAEKQMVKAMKRWYK